VISAFITNGNAPSLNLFRRSGYQIVDEMTYVRKKLDPTPRDDLQLLPIFSYAASASSRSCRFRPAVTMFRIRALSFATIGRRSGGEHALLEERSRTPRDRRVPEHHRRDRRLAVAMSKPMETSCFLKYRVFLQSFFTWAGSVSRR